nr:OmpA family protein [uncultured Rhodopila sp.]
MNGRRAARDRSAAGDEPAGDGYFASVSDLMVGVLFMFLLMLTVFALNYKDAEQAQTVERATYEAAQRDLEQQQTLARQARAEAARESLENEQLRALLKQATARIRQDLGERAASRTSLLIALQRMMHERNVVVSIDPETGILRLPADSLFATGSATLEPRARAVVRTLADVLVTTLPCADAAPCSRSASLLETVLVEGHTDRQRFEGLDIAASQDRNDRLSADRALAVFLELRRAQPGLDRVVNAAGQPLIGVSGYGERRPRADAACSAEANCPANRRIDLRFVLSPPASIEMQPVLDDAGGRP